MINNEYGEGCLLYITYIIFVRNRSQGDKKCHTGQLQRRRAGGVGRRTEVHANGKLRIRLVVIRRSEYTCCGDFAKLVRHSSVSLRLTLYIYTYMYRYHALCFFSSATC